MLLISSCWGTYCLSIRPQGQLRVIRPLPPGSQSRFLALHGKLASGSTQQAGSSLHRTPPIPAPRIWGRTALRPSPGSSFPALRLWTLASLNLRFLICKVRAPILLLRVVRKSPGTHRAHRRCSFYVNFLFPADPEGGAVDGGESISMGEPGRFERKSLNSGKTENCP